MKATTLLKLAKFLRMTKVLLPVAALAVGLATRVEITHPGHPGGDPIDDDPLPF